MQFGSFQDVPADATYSEELNACNGRSGDLDWAERHNRHLYLWTQREGLIIPMLVMNNPTASNAYRVWYHTHGRLFIGNPEHRQDQGYVQCSASLNDVMCFIRDLHLRAGEAGSDGARCLDLVREIHIRTRDYLQRAGYGYFVDVPPISSIMHRSTSRCSLAVLICDDSERTGGVDLRAAGGVCVR
nr:serine/threonine-protein phosphatase 7 long form homolog isoform X1 [Ipomoea batatas]